MRGITRLRMRRPTLLLVALAAALLAACRPQHPADRTQQTFRFDERGEFTVMQLTDLHYTGDELSAHVPGMLVQLIRLERPDLIVVTGDLIYRRPGERLMREICGIIAAEGIPYAVTPGNHDAEQGITQQELHALFPALPGCVNPQPRTGEAAAGDFVLPVLARGSDREEARLYVMDSNDYNADDRSYKGFEPEQVAWYRRQSAEAEARNGRKTNALLFFHVPLPEYAEAYAEAPLAGYRLERECPPRDNVGMFRALVECGEATGVFAGHDHSNDYVAEKEGIALCYGRYSGGYGEYQELLSGARMIRLREGRRGFDTWVRLANGRTSGETTYPTQQP